MPVEVVFVLLEEVVFVAFEVVFDVELLLVVFEVALVELLVLVDVEFV